MNISVVSLQLYPEGLHSMKWRRESLFFAENKALETEVEGRHDCPTHTSRYFKKEKKREKILLHLKDNIVTRIIKSIMKSRNG